MKFRTYLSSFALLCLSFTFLTTATAQQRNCAAMDYLEQQIKANPSIQDNMDAIESQTRDFIKYGSSQSSVNGIITIPTVVHVVYRNNTQNISAAQVQSQMQVLNDDFRRLNSDANNTWSQASDTQIEFCLATVDPNGNPTNGITRTSTSVNGFGTNDAVKSANSGGKNAWATDKYLNMWVCAVGGGILGYAQFPGSGSAATDGVVMDYQYFGTIGTAAAPFDGGRTATHEVGHWLNLRHIWGDGNCNADDFVSDTPTSDAANYGCATGHTSCGSVDMVQNYMDYSDDSCMNLFTNGQKSRMRALFDTGGFRASLLSSNGCGNSTPSPTCNDGVQNGTETGVDCGGSCQPCSTACNGADVNISITLDNYPEETSWTLVDANGTQVGSGGTYGDQADGATVSVSGCLADGCYTFTITDAYGDGICCSYGDGSYTITVDGQTVASGGDFGSSEAKEFCIGGTTEPTPTCTDGIQNGDEVGIDCGGSSCAPCPCQDVVISITLDNYPEETSWTLADASGSQIGSGGTYGDQADGATVSASGCLDLGCYTFTITDAYGDGICCSYGNGSYNIIVNGASVATGGSFGSSESKTFCVGGNARAITTTTTRKIEREGKPFNAVTLFPNPANEYININYDLATKGDVELNVVDLAGRQIFNQTISSELGEYQERVDISNLKAGYYLVVIKQGDTQVTKKFVKL